MRVDTNTRGHRQWFYFSIRSKQKRTVKLNIYRFWKFYSLYQRGMQPYVRSVRSQGGWKPAGTNVKYNRERQNDENGANGGYSHQFLSFEYEFLHDEDEVFFAAGVPYTYTFLQQRIGELVSASQSNKYLTMCRSVAGRSVSGLDVSIIKIEPREDKETKKTKKKIIVVNARTHPGEASCSWVLDGLIDFLTKEPKEPAIGLWMKEANICFHIMPMLNVDGVFMGNYRTGIVGEDFNRKFCSEKEELFPEISYLKGLVSNAKQEGQVAMFIDLHGHSILKNSFIYGPSENEFTTALRKCLSIFSEEVPLLLMAQVQVLQNVIVQVPHRTQQGLHGEDVLPTAGGPAVFHL